MAVLLITGGSGYLGRHLCRMAAKSHRVHTTFFSHAHSVAAGAPHRLHLTDVAAVRTLMQRVSPDAVIHCAAINPGRGDERQMFAVNRDGTANIATVAAEMGVRLVHISTDMVYDGTHAPYSPDAPLAPNTPYGTSKAAAELVVADIHPTAAIVRTSLIYGLEEMDRGTAGFVRRLEAGGSLTLFQDQIRQPVWVETLSDALLKLATGHRHLRGVWHVAGRQVLSRADFGERLLDWWGVGHRARVRRGFAADLPVPTPLDLRLEISAAEAALGMVFPGVDTVLEICQSRQS